MSKNRPFAMEAFALEYCPRLEQEKYGPLN